MKDNIVPEPSPAQGHASIAQPQTPERVCLRRVKGWRMPPNTVKVDRSTQWGNPFSWREAQAEWGCSESEAKSAVVAIYQDWLQMREPERFSAELRKARVTILANLNTLRGKNLACWCKEFDDCHADALLVLANRFDGSASDRVTADAEPSAGRLRHINPPSNLSGEAG